MPRINTSIKILTAVLLAGFILSNITLIGLAAEPLFCPDGSPSSLDPITGKFTCEKEKQVEKEKAVSSFDVETSGATTVKLSGQCLSVGFSADKNGKCPKDAERFSCPEDPNKYRCFQIVVEQSEIQKYTTYSKIPCQPVFGGACPKEEEGPAAYIARLYQFGLMIAGLLAFGSIIYGSLKYILSAGNIGSTEEAKDIIRQAIYGLVLLLGAYLILYTINPNLVNLRNPNAPPLDIASVIKKGALPDEQRLPSVSNEAHPLCQSGVSSGLTVKSNIKIEGPLKEELGVPSEIIDFNCLKCKANAVKSSVSDCKCDAGFVPNDAGNGCIRPVGVTAPELLPKQQSPIFEYQPPNYVELPKQQ